MVKKPKLTPEEKKALAAERKKQKKLAAAEKVLQIKRDYLTRELKYAETSRKKLEPIWREMMLKIRLTEIGIDYQVAVHTFEKIIDTKDYIINILKDELDDARNQYYYTIANYFTQIDNIYNIFQLKMQDLKEKYDTDLKTLANETYKSFNIHQSKQEESENFLKEMTFGLDMKGNNIEKFQAGEYLAKLTGEDNKHTEEVNTKKYQVETTFELLWNSYNEVIKNYLKENREQTKYFKINSMENEASQKLNAEQSRQILELHGKIMKLKYDQKVIKDSYTEQLDRYYKEKDFFKNAVNYLRKQLINDEKYNNEKLKTLVVTSGEVIQNLTNIVKKGENILSFVNMTRKFETRKEKVLAFPEISLATTSSCLSQYYDDESFKELGNFWYKVAQIDAKRQIINEERIYLQQLNNYLKEENLRLCKQNAFRCTLPKIKPRKPPTAEGFQILLKVHQNIRQETKRSSTDLLLAKLRDN